MGTAPTPGQRVVDSRVRALTASGTDVYVGTDAVNVAGHPAGRPRREAGTARPGAPWARTPRGGDGVVPALDLDQRADDVGVARLRRRVVPERARAIRAPTTSPSSTGRRGRPVGSNGGADGAHDRRRPRAHHVRPAARRGRRLHRRRRERARGLRRHLPARRRAGGGGGGRRHDDDRRRGGGAAAPPTGTPTGTVLVNGRPFTGGTIPYRSVVDVTNGRLTLRADTGTITVRGAEPASRRCSCSSAAPTGGGRSSSSG